MWRSKTRYAAGFFAASLLFLSAGSIFCQQPPASAPAYHDVYYTRSGIVPAQLKPLQYPALARINRCKRYDGSALVAAIIDPRGRPRYLYFIRPVGNDLDRVILKIVKMDRFKPATLHGMPVASAMEGKVKAKSCAVQKDEGNGREALYLELRREPTESAKPMKQPLHAITRIVEAARPGSGAGMVTPVPAWLRSGAVPPLANPPLIWVITQEHLVFVPAGPGFGVVPPQPVNSVEAQYTLEARRKGISGACLVQTMVGVNGMPEDLHMLKSLEPGLDRNALIAVGRYRFRPALKNGVPVPAIIWVEVNFRLY